MAQEESHNKSEIMNASIEMRFKRGIFLKPPLLGYDVNEDGELVINEEEAKTVRLIFFMYLYGYTCQQIAYQLTALKRPTKKGNLVWNPGSILQIFLMCNPVSSLSSRLAHSSTDSPSSECPAGIL